MYALFRKYIMIFCIVFVEAPYIFRKFTAFMHTCAKSVQLLQYAYKIYYRQTLQDAGQVQIHVVSGVAERNQE